MSSKRRSPSTRYVFNLNKPSCQTLSNASEMSEKIPLTSAVGLSSKADCISCIMDNSWAMHESCGRKPDWAGVKSLLCWKYLKNELQTTLSKILAKIGSKLIG